jgi:uncharacterized membrane protein HdeD (DUF308 family)
MDDVTRVAKEWWLVGILGLVSLVAGILVIAYPGPTLLLLGLIFGINLLLLGIFELIEAVAGDPDSRALSAIVGVVGILAGLICIRRPGESLLALVVVVGAYLVVAGCVRLVRAFSVAEDRGIAILAAIVDLVLGILILAWPDVSLKTLAILFGISLIVRGAFACVRALALRRVRKDAASASPGAAPA